MPRRRCRHRHPAAWRAVASLLVLCGLGASNAALAALAAPAQPRRGITLPEALAYARQHQPSLAGALARVAAAAADARVARAQWLPSFGATAQAFEGTTNNSTASYVGVPEVALPRIGGTPTSSTGTFRPSTSTLAAVGGNQEVFDFGRIAAQAAVADATYQAEKHRAYAERLRVDLVVKDAFFGVLAARAVLQAAEGAFARAQAHRDMAAAQVKTGLHAPIELTRAEADLTRFDVARVRAAGGLASAQSVFAAAVGADDLMLDATGGAPPEPPPPPVEQGLKAAADRDPLLLEARTRVQAADALTRAIAAQLRPDLSLTGAFSGRAGTATPTSGPLSPDYGPLPTIANWDVGLVLRWPLYDPVVAARRDAAAARAGVARAEVAVLSQQETAVVQQAYVAQQVAQVALVALRRAVDAAQANDAQAEARFKAGLGTSLELADAEAVRTDAEIQLAVGEYDVQRARAALARLLAEGS
ncbi:MAG TPA: TolC family protein [Polyangia bacterium]|nr:TolC family protein [Polyangia bacterium]